MAKGGVGLIGSWAFLIGVILAIVLGSIGVTNATVSIVLVVIGIIVGLLNITTKEVQPFLLSGTVLIIAGALGQNAVSTISQIGDVLSALLLIFVPATIIVALKNVFGLARR